LVAVDVPREARRHVDRDLDRLLLPARLHDDAAHVRFRERVVVLPGVLVPHDVENRLPERAGRVLELIEEEIVRAAGAGVPEDDRGPHLAFLVDHLEVDPVRVVLETLVLVSAVTVRDVDPREENALVHEGPVLVADRLALQLPRVAEVRVHVREMLFVPRPRRTRIAAVRPLVVTDDAERRHREARQLVLDVDGTTLTARLAARVDVADVYVEVRRAVLIVKVHVLREVRELAAAVRVVAGHGERDGLALAARRRRGESDREEDDHGGRGQAADSERFRCRSHGCNSRKHWDSMRLRSRCSA
jgi:hypothetical protein